MTTSKRKQPERIMLRVTKGAMVPASELSVQALRRKGYRVGDVVSAEMRQPRNPGFHRLAHALGAVLAENVEAFEGLGAHRVLKRLQWESGVGCEEMGVQVPNVGPMTVRIPLSLSFESMDEGEFREVYTGLCNHVRRTYWRDLPEGEVERIAELFSREAA